MAAGEEKRHLLTEGAAGSYLGTVQEDGHSSLRGQAPALELGTRRHRHCHALGAADHPGQQQRARRKLYVAAGICLVFMLGEAVGGYLAHSLAILTDAAHLLTDFASVMISLFALWVSSRPATKTMNFGWHRAEILGALLSVLSIWVVTGVLVYLAAQRLLSADYEIEGGVMLITSACAVAVNIVMGVALHQTGHGHGHGEPGEQPNASVRAAFVHVVGDLLQSVGVLVASYIIFFKTPAPTRRRCWRRPARGCSAPSASTPPPSRSRATPRTCGTAASASPPATEPPEPWHPRPAPTNF
nr:zinc transporter 2 isoform X2 [Anas platyrhynchos]